jgi:DNA-binding CsgD family transcriptional regulator
MKGARGAIERGLAIARAVGDPFPVASLAAVAAMAVHRTDMNALRAYVEESIASVPAEMVTNATDVALAYSSIGLSAVGDHVGALRVVEEYVSTVDSDQISLVFYEAFYLRAWLNWRAGNRWDAQLAETTARMTSVMPYISGWFAGTEADHLLDRGDTRAAMAILAGADVWALYRAMHDRISARVALAEGDVGRAVELAHSALALAWEQSDNVTAVEAVDVLAVATAVGGAAADGARIVGAGDAIRAAIGWCRGVPEQAWIDALDVDESARAETAAMSVEDAIAYVQRGRGKRGRPSFGWSSLTPTEVDVVRLVSEGLRNKEIAEKLFMSPATVKTHLTHVFAKLGVATRTELAAQAAQRTTA